MLTNRFLRPTASRRRPRRRAALRRSWTIQRLEPRCVMAADLFTDVTTQDEQTDLGLSEKISEPPAIFDYAQSVESDDAKTPDDANWNEIDVDAIVFAEASSDGASIEQPDSLLAAPELNLALDLSNVVPITFKTVEQQSVVLTFDAAQLESLYDASGTLLLHVEYDATAWAMTGVESTATTNETQLRIVSLVSQATDVSIEVQPADPLQPGSPTSVIVKLNRAGSTADADAEYWTTADWQLDDMRGRSGSIEATIGSEFATTSDPSRFSPIDSSKTAGQFDPGDDLDDSFSDGPASTWAGEEAGETQPLNESESTPLPESRRESVERVARPARRTIDIRTQGPSTWSVAAISRAPVSPESLATQSALASVYDGDHQSANETARHMLDPKPARLQVATFLLSRAQRDGSTVVVNVTKPVAKIEEPAKENSLSQVEAQRPVRPTLEGNTQSSVTRVAATPSEAEVTAAAAEHTLTKNPERVSEEEPASLPQPVYASVIDRLLGSPISLVAILGLTVVARLSESDEIIG